MHVGMPGACQQGEVEAGSLPPLQAQVAVSPETAWLGAPCRTCSHIHKVSPGCLGRLVGLTVLFCQGLGLPLIKMCLALLHRLCWYPACVQRASNLAVLDCTVLFPCVAAGRSCALAAWAGAVESVPLCCNLLIRHRQG